MRRLCLNAQRQLGSLPSGSIAESVKECLREVVLNGERLIQCLSTVDHARLSRLPLRDISVLSGSVRDAAHAARPRLEKFDGELSRQKQAKWEAAGKPDGRFDYRPVHDGLRCQLWEVAASCHRLQQFSDGTEAALANDPVLLISGSAGKGKTHLLVDVAKRRVKIGLPTIVMLGENFKDSDPLGQIMEFVGLNRDQDEFLQAIEAAAEASGGRFLFMIDALNEGAGLRLWPKRLSGFIRLLSSYPRIGVALSVRTTYEEAVVPEAVRSSAIRVVHDGFASRPEFAARAFFSHYGINLPSIPLINPEFTDPLLLKLLCKGLHDQGLHDVPTGPGGVSRIFDFLVAATNDKLRRSGNLDIGPHDNAVREYLGRLADALADSDTEAVAFDQARKISSKVYPHPGYKGSLLDLLLHEGLLGTEMVRASGDAEAGHGVGFAYQRFGDHERAKRLLDRCPTLLQLEGAFRNDGVIGSLLNEGYGFYRHQGLLEALSIQIPERFGRELLPLVEVAAREKDDYRDSVLAECLVESLLWRSAESITDGTFEALKATISTARNYNRYWDIILTLGSVPDHPLNAKRLHGILSGMALPERDEFWVPWLYWNHEDGAADRMVSWALHANSKDHLSDESLLLACTELAWFTASTVKPLRDRATKALVSLLTPRPRLMAPLLDQFDGVDDPYVTERLYAAAYGVALRLLDDGALGKLAADVFGRLFGGREAPIHALIRDYGRLVVERAVSQGCVLPFDPAGARPPYGSEMPPEPPSRQHFEDMAKPTGQWTDTDRTVSHVVDRFSEFDVSEYFGGPPLKYAKFSSLPLTSEPRVSRQRIKEEWERSLDANQLQLWNEANRLRWLNYSTALVGVPL